MRGHKHVNSILEVCRRRLPSDTVVRCAFLLGCHPHGVDLLSLDVELHKLVFIYTNINMHIGFVHFGVLGYTVHDTTRFAVARTTSVVHVVLVSDRQGRIRYAGESVIHLRIVVVYCGIIGLRYALKRSNRQAADWHHTPGGTSIGTERGIRSCNSGRLGLKLVGSGISSDIVRNTALYTLLHMSPALVCRNVHTREQPVGILHIAVYTGDEGGLLEVRSVRSVIELINEDVVVSAQVREERVVVFAVGTVLEPQHRRLSRVHEVSLLISCQQVTVFSRPHTCRSIALTIRAEEHSFHRVTYGAEGFQFLYDRCGKRISVPFPIHRGPISVSTVVLVVQSFVPIPDVTVVVEYTGLRFSILGIKCRKRGAFNRSIFITSVDDTGNAIHIKHLITPEERIHG